MSFISQHEHTSCLHTYISKYKYTESEGDVGNIWQSLTGPAPAESHPQTLKLYHWFPCVGTLACSTRAALSQLSGQGPSQHPHSQSWHLCHLPLSRNCLISVPRCCWKGWSALETWSSSATGLWSVCCSTGGSDAEPPAPHEHAQVFPQAQNGRVRKPPAPLVHSPSAPAETYEERREEGFITLLSKELHIMSLKKFNSCHSCVLYVHYQL